MPLAPFCTPLEEQSSVWLPACVCLRHCWPRDQQTGHAKREPDRAKHQATEATHENIQGNEIGSLGNSDIDNGRRDACTDSRAGGSIGHVETAPGSAEA